MPYSLSHPLSFHQNPSSQQVPLLMPLVFQGSDIFIQRKKINLLLICSLDLL